MLVDSNQNAGVVLTARLVLDSTPKRRKVATGSLILHLGIGWLATHTLSQGRLFLQPQTHTYFETER